MKRDGEFDCRSDVDISSAAVPLSDSGSLQIEGADHNDARRGPPPLTKMPKLALHEMLNIKETYARTALCSTNSVLNGAMPPGCANLSGGASTAYASSLDTQ